MLDAAERVGAAVEGFAREAATRSREAVGVVRVTCPEPIVARLVASGLVDRFHARHPRLRVEFLASDRYLDLAAGEVDVAMRSGDPDDPALVGRRIGDSLWAVYASPGYLERHGRPEAVAALAGHRWVGLDASMSGHRLSQWLASVVPESAIVARNGSVLGLVSTARAGVALAALPLALGDAEPGLQRVLGPIPELTRMWRVLTTPEMRRTPRVSAFFDFVVDEMDALRPIITG
jgi:DNA-binding transcriptional LysR family regulator